MLRKNLCLVLAAGGALSISQANADTCISCTTQTGTHCFTVTRSDGNAWGAECGSSAGVSQDTRIGQRIQVSCGKVAYSIELGSSRGWNCSVAAPECSRCTLQICYPNSTVTIRTCTYKVKVCVPTGDTCMGFPIKDCWYEERTRTISSFQSGGSAYCSSSCTPDPCHCRSMGRDCDCPPAELAPGLIPGPVGAIVPFSVISVDVAQLVDTLNNAPLHSLADMTGGQLVELRELLAAAVRDQGSPTQVVVGFQNGTTLSGTESQVLSAIENQLAFWLKSDRRFDLDGDGIITNADLIIFDAVRPTAQGLHGSALDFDASLAVGSDDRCQLVGQIGIAVE